MDKSEDSEVSKHDNITCDEKVLTIIAVEDMLMNSNNNNQLP